MFNPRFPITYRITQTHASPGFVVANIPVGPFPMGIAFNSNTGKLHVVNQNNSCVSVIDHATNTVVDTITVGNSPVSITFNLNTGLCMWQKVKVPRPM